jgi:hypothetical protein
LSTVKRIASGGVIVDAMFARTGVQTYVREDGSVSREYRPPEEVFSERTLASLRGAPITIGHKGQVNPKNWRETSIGTVLSGKKHDVKVDGEEWISGEALVSDADAIARLGVDLVENSLGYEMDLDPTPGVTPTGERYDAVQRNIIANHNAFGKQGFARAGRSAKLRLDGNQEIVTDSNDEGVEEVSEVSKRMIQCDGVSVEYGSETHVSLLEKQTKTANDRADSMTAKVTELEKKIGTETARADDLDKQVKKLTTDASPEAIEAKVKDELDFRTKMIPLVEDGFDFSKKPRRDVLISAVAKIDGNKRFDANDSETTIAAYLEGRIASGIDYNKPAGGEKRDDGARNDYASFLANVGKPVK